MKKHLLLILTLAAVAATLGTARVESQVAPTGCAAAVNPIACENALRGDGDWDITGVGDESIQGFASEFSVDVTERVEFKIATDSLDYTIDVYRLGEYSGAGARKVGSTSLLLPQGVTRVEWTAARGQPQPACVTDPATGLFDCGTWAVTAYWQPPPDTVSGVYVAKLTRHDGSLGSSHIVFIVRDDNRRADLIFQTSDTTWQAYNRYGGTGTGAPLVGASTYCGGPVSNANTGYACAGRAVKVSYNRPFDTRVTSSASWLFSAEYPMIRFLESNGYDVKYWSGVDTDRRGADLVGARRPNVFLSVGHDEYWSGAQRAYVETARDAGVSLAFFSGNEVYWKTRWEPSIDGTGASHKTLVTYKETLAGAKIDPAMTATGQPIWTGTWRDSRFSPPADGGRPENALIGSLFTVSCCSTAITVPEVYGKTRFWRNTPIANLAPGAVARLPEGTLGYEWGEVVDNGFRPAGLIALSSTRVENVPERLTDFGANVAPGSATHNLTLYRHTSVDANGVARSALVFGASTVQWSWGLDAHHDGTAFAPDPSMRQATVNLLADMGAQPGTLAGDLSAASASTDTEPPSVVITAPVGGSTLQSGSRITIAGQAADAAGVVAGVEVSVDDGQTWQQARGTSSWTFEWTVGATTGLVPIRARAIDDSGNIESGGATTTVNVTPGLCPCTSLWKNTDVPAVSSVSDFAAINLGVKFHTTAPGYITGIRFYKGPSNVGTHFGSLWTSQGVELARVTFTTESATGWQQALFSQPVAVAANTTYVASYHTTFGAYAATSRYFESASVDSPPLHARSSLVTGGNGVFKYGSLAFPNASFNSTNYWVDVVFAPSLVDTTPPTIDNINARVISSETAVISWTTNEAATSRIDYSSDPAILQDAAPPPADTLTVSSNTHLTVHQLALSGLVPDTTYYYRVTSMDAAGNRATAAGASFRLPRATLRDRVAADFAMGTHVATYTSETSDGEVILAPLVGAEFSGTALPAGWRSVSWANGAPASVNAGMLTVDGSRVGTCVVSGTSCLEQATEQAPRSLQFVANFSGEPFEHSGFATTLEAAPWAIFSTGSGNVLLARTMNETGAFLDTPLGDSYLGRPHRYRIDWFPGRVDFFIDGVLLVSHPIAIAGPMRPIAASDVNPNGLNVAIDWMRLAPYAASGTFVSRVADAHAVVSWRSAQWAADVPPQTTLAISARVGNALDIQGNIVSDAWIPIPTSGAPFNADGRYIQYRAEMTTANPYVTPALKDIVFSVGAAPVAGDDSLRVSENTPTVFPAIGPSSLIANDTDADGDPLAIRTVSSPAHGTVSLDADGTITYTPASGYRGLDTFTYVVTDGLLTDTGTVTVNVGALNNVPVAADDVYRTSEDTALAVTAVTGVLANDTDADSDALTVSLTTGPANGVLVLNADGSFVYTPSTDFAGTVTFTYTISDGESTSAVATAQIVVDEVNDAPAGLPDAYTTVRDQTLSVAAPGVLANDRDDTPSLTAVLFGAGPAHGSSALGFDGSFTYVPAPGYIGEDSFAYQVRDASGVLSPPVHVTIAVTASAVTLHAQAGETVSTGNAVNSLDPVQVAVTPPAAATIDVMFGLLGSADVPSGYTFINRQVKIAITDANAQAMRGTLAAPLAVSFVLDSSVLPDGATEQSIELFRDGVPLAECPGATAIPLAELDPCISHRARDAAGLANIRLLTTRGGMWRFGVPTSLYGIEPLGRADQYSTAENTKLTLPIPGVLANDLGRGALSATLIAAPPASSGTLEFHATGQFAFLPAPDVSGTTAFSYVPHDGTLAGQPTTVVVTVRPVNRAPAFTAGPNISVAEDSGAQTIAAWASNITTGRESEAGQTLTFMVTNDNPQLFVAPPAISVDGTLTFESRANANGSATVYVRLHDSGGTQDGGADTSDEQTFVISVQARNDAPVITSIADQTTLEGAAVGPVSFSVSDIETASANLTLTATSSNATLLPLAGIVLGGSGSTRSITITPAPGQTGTAQVSVVVTDVDGASAAEVLAVTVQPRPRTITSTSTPTSSLSPSTFGGAVTLRSSVTASTGIVDGTVTFLDGDAALGTVALSAGQAQLTTTALPAGSRQIKAVYHGNTNFAPSESAAFTQTVQKATASPLTLSVSVAQPQYSDVQTFTASYTAAAGMPVPQKVSFKVGTQIMGEAPLVRNGTTTTYIAKWTGQLLEPPAGTSPVGQLKPAGGRIVTASTADSNFNASSTMKSFTILREDARVAYAGPSTFSLSNGRVVLSVTVKDISAAPGEVGFDTNAGEIRHAQVQFVNRATGAILATVPVVPSEDPRIGTATFEWAAATATTYNIGFVVTNYYLRNSSLDNVTITVTP